jgi:hypothetical protein
MKEFKNTVLYFRVLNRRDVWSLDQLINSAVQETVLQSDFFFFVFGTSNVLTPQSSKCQVSDDVSNFIEG